MSQRGGFRGRYKGRGRSTPYSRDGGGFRKGFRNQGGHNKANASDGNDMVTSKSEANSNHALEVPTIKSEQVPDQPVPEVAPRLATPNVGSSPSYPPSNQATPDSLPKEKKYSVKARLFVGNLPKDTKQEQVREMFEVFGEVKEVFVQKEKSFGFVRMAYRSEAEKAVAALNGKIISGRDIKVRFAASNSSVKISNLNPVVSNELLEEAFSQFGEVEKAVVVTDERGKSLGYGIVDFSRKSFAMNALRRCSEDHFFLTKTPMPVLVVEYVKDNDEEGQPEKSISKNATYRMEREAPPRFAQPNTLEFAVATQWKMAYDSEKRQREELEQHLRQSRNNLVHEMENIKEQHQTELIRQELAHHQQEQLRLVQQLRMRQGSVPSNSMLEGSATGNVASFFPMQPADKPPEALLENPSYIGGGVGQVGGGGGGTFPSGGSNQLPLFPPPLMGQHSVFKQKFH